MTMLDRLVLWREQGTISPEQEGRLAALVRDEPFSLSVELNILLYAGVLAFVGGLGWTISTWSQQLGDLLIVTVLSVLLAVAFWYCFSHAGAWSASQVAAPTPFFDYSLYFGCLLWCAELVYLENRFHVLSGQWDIYLLATAILFFALAYRFDNRLVLSLALSSLAGWFGIKVSSLPAFENGAYRHYALLYCTSVAVSGAVLQGLKFKPHFFGTYLNVVANVFFWTVLSGVFQERHASVWVVALSVACAASLAWGLRKLRFAFVAYASIYGYIGVSFLLLSKIGDVMFALLYFMVTAVLMVAMLITIARSFGRPR